MDADSQNLTAVGLQSVCVGVFNDRFSAEFAAAFLETSEVICWINTEDCAGLMPVLSIGGVRLYTGSDQAEAARVLLASFLQVGPTHPVSGLELFGDPPYDQPKFIILSGIWFLVGAKLSSLLILGTSVAVNMNQSLTKLFIFLWILCQVVICVYMLFSAVRNYSIQRKRAAERKPD